MKIIDDVVPEVIQDYLEDLVTKDSTFPWTFLDDVTFPSSSLEKVQSVYGFAHMSIDRGNVNLESKVGFVTHVPVIMMCEKFGLNIKQLTRQRWGMYLPTPYRTEHHNVHVDDRDNNHVVLLYYVNDSDGDTFFFDEDNKIVDKVTPKKGRAVVFPGKTFHASSSPTKNVRVTMNLNFHGHNRDIYTSAVSL